MQQILGFTHILLDDGEPIGVAKDIEEIHEMELGNMLLFEWPDGMPPEFRPMYGRDRIEVSDASPDILQKVQLQLCLRPALV